jgi:hypothetical protein
MRAAGAPRKRQESAPSCARLRERHHTPGGSRERGPMKEYKVLRESEPNQPSWAAETTRDRLETKINELARGGWVVKSFQVNHVPGAPGFGFRTANVVYFVLLERERADSGTG